MADTTQAVVLAAGHGTRMRSDLPKVLHGVGGRPLLAHAIDLARSASTLPPLVVVPTVDGPIATLARELGADVVAQGDRRGTGGALLSIPPASRVGTTIVVLNADLPLLTAATLTGLAERHRSAHAAATLLTVFPSDVRTLGRIRRDENENIVAVIEERDLQAAEAGTARECNGGAYVFRADVLWEALGRLTPDNAQNELYLTDVIGDLASGGATITSVTARDPSEAMGVNDRVQLAAAEAALRHRTLEGLMRAGVTVDDPLTTYIDTTVQIGRDTCIAPMSVVRGETVIGSGCHVGPGAFLCDVRAGNGVQIGQSTLEGCVVGDDVTIGPYNRIRPGSQLGAGVRLGTHAEVKNSRVGEGTRIGHFSCVLDSDIGADVNMSAGVITCNFDGWTKSRTTVGDRAFVGSDAMLVAPVTIGPDAYVAAGSTITEDVPAGALAVERAEQRTLEGWTRRRRRRHAAEATP